MSDLLKEVQVLQARVQAEKERLTRLLEEKRAELAALNTTPPTPPALSKQTMAALKGSDLWVEIDTKIPVQPSQPRDPVLVMKNGEAYTIEEAFGNKKKTRSQKKAAASPNLADEEADDTLPETTADAQEDVAADDQKWLEDMMASSGEDDWPEAGTHDQSEPATDDEEGLHADTWLAEMPTEDAGSDLLDNVDGSVGGKVKESSDDWMAEMAMAGEGGDSDDWLADFG